MRAWLHPADRAMARAVAPPNPSEAMTSIAAVMMRCFASDDSCAPTASPIDSSTPMCRTMQTTPGRDHLGTAGRPSRRPLKRSPPPSVEARHHPAGYLVWVSMVTRAALRRGRNRSQAPAGAPTHAATRTGHMLWTACDGSVLSRAGRLLQWVDGSQCGLAAPQRRHPRIQRRLLLPG